MNDFYNERRRDRVADREQDRADALAAAEQKRKSELAAAELRRQDEAEREERSRRTRRETDRERARRKAERKAARGELFAKLRREGDTTGALIVMAAGIIAALYFQLRALNGENLPGVISLCLAVMLEAGAWVATTSGERAKREGRPAGRFRVVMWACASFAALINYSHAPESSGGWLAWVLAAASYAAVFFWEVRGWGRHGTKATRTKAQRREDRRRRRHDRKRRTRFPTVYSRYLDILTAHPFATVDAEEAWRTAWRDEHGADLATTARVVARRGHADKALAAAHGVGVETLVVEQLLGELFPPDGGDDGPAARRSSGGPSGGPNKSGRTAKTLGRKGKQAIGRVSGRTAPKVPDRPLDAAHIAQVRALADLLGGAAHLSVKNVRQAVGGGNYRYAMRLRDHVKAERKNAR
ncbi:DUF2637 domain-containing protein [Streptomyces sp. H10-C2]|uniref:DUF2637 domain-containing protein n=1 Tax=unclassified Streptomyces TaxID=2593676 RepID=UPI0024BA70C5|nr:MULTISPECIES: DUF2637 domain-containing protein [unclassified Streptomyces]MDJ0345538.1 DUF2637 domain-containing protein [Streptomyces sp. PH10-H1]MDJ0374484.1 DUF2637 domain-containing protein [Streptomyces sp. H10-C2]